MTTPNSRPILLALAAVALAGCAGRASLFPNDDPQLHKSSAQFAFNAAKQFPYPADAPSGGDALAQAEVGYALDHLDLVNLSPTDWTDLNVWVNGTYVVHLDDLKGGTADQPPPVLKIPFRAFFGPDGKTMPTSGFYVDKVELVRDGKLYGVPVKIAE